MLVPILLLVAGLVVLYFGAELLVDGASKIALSFGISPMIIGLTVVAAATSMPEFVVSLLATLGGSPDLALGNVVGSNVANIALIVGASAVILPMTVERSVFVRDYPWMIATLVLSLVTAYLGRDIDRPDGIALLILLALFLAVCVRVALAQNREFRATGQMAALDPAHTRTARNAFKVLVGVVGLIIGARLMVDNAVMIARHFGISELIIGVTIVALGTSLPELATAVVAALKNEPDISLGNIIGSNIFNTCFILGGVAVIKPIDVADEALRFDLPAMAAISLLLFPIMRRDNRVSRMDGGALLLMYVAYLTFSYLFATGRIAG